MVSTAFAGLEVTKSCVRTGGMRSWGVRCGTVWEGTHCVGGRTGVCLVFLQSTAHPYTGQEVLSVWGQWGRGERAAEGFFYLGFDR